MKIGIDARLALRKRRGMGRVLLNLIDHLSMIDKENQYILYLEKEDTECILPTADNFMKRVLPPRIYPLWEQISLPIACKMDKVDVLHCPANTGPVVVPRSVKLIVTVHDAIFLKPRSEVPLSSSIYQNLGRVYRYFCARLLRNRIDHIITPSHFSKHDIQESLGISAEKITVIPNGIDNYFFQRTRDDYEVILERLHIAGKFIFHLGGISPNKNTIMAIRAYNLLIQEKKHRDLQLVVGGIPPESNNPSTQFAKRKELRGKVTFLSHVTDKELKSLYSKAELFLFPSLYEGFGLPPLEAMVCGTPVVASNLTAVPEVVGQAGILVDPRDPDKLVAAMIRVLNNTEFRKGLIKSGIQHVQEFRWEKLAKRLLHVYASVGTE